jgi:hypothetical protein
LLVIKYETEEFKLEICIFKIGFNVPADLFGKPKEV